METFNDLTPQNLVKNWRILTLKLVQFFCNFSFQFTFRMGPKVKAKAKNNLPKTGTKRKDPPPVESEDSTSGSEAETGEGEPDDTGDAGEDNTRLSKSAVHAEYVRTSETFQVKSKTGKKVEVTKWKSACKHCTKVFEHKRHWGLKRHLMTKHPDVSKVVEDIDDRNREEQRSRKDKTVVSKELKVLDAYVKFLINDGIPLSTSSSPHFKEFVSSLDPEITIPGRHGITDLIDKKYQEMLDKLKARLAEARRCHLTMDGWSNRRCRSSFLGVTVHFFCVMKRQSQSFRLCLRKFNSRHTAHNILRMTEGILDEFGIREKTHAIVTDNGANYRRGVLDMAEKEVPTRDLDMNMNLGAGRANEITDEFLPELITDDDLLDLPDETEEEKEERERDNYIKQLEDEIDDFASVRRTFDLSPLRCMAHLIQLPIMRTIRDKNNVFHDLLGHVRTLVKKYSKSVNAKEELYKLVQLQVVCYVVTRWWTDVDMMERMIRINKKNPKALNKVVSNCDWNEDLMLTKDDLTLMEKFVALFKPIQKMADQLNGEDYSTIHLVLPIIKDIKDHIDGFKKDKIIGQTAKCLSKEFDEYCR